ncbi:MAG: ABC transporter ATP-binding protein [Halanaerobium sp.]
MNRGNKILNVKNLKKKIGEKAILNIDQYSVIKNKFNFIIGANGSGKTTLLNILSLIDRDYEGDIYYKGKLLSKNGKHLELRRKFSVIWQDPYLYRGDVFYNIALPLELRGVNKSVIKKKVKEIMERIEITELVDQSVHTISGGEKQKVSIARALITDPEVLFVDEATTSLDEDSIKFFNSHFADLVTDDMTVIMVTHDRRQIELLADRITFLKKGRIVTSKPAENFDFQHLREGICAPVEEVI